MGRGVSDYQPLLAGELGTAEHILRLPAADPQGDLYDQCYRISERLVAQSDQDAPLIPNRRVGDEGAVSGLASDIEEVDDADTGLEAGHEPIHYPVRRANRTVINRHLHRKIYSLARCN